ncbi:MAG: hypothetical protein U0X20_17865 [Caldilineaceae bacterium]
MALFTSALVDEVTTLLDRRRQTLQQPTLAEDLRLLIRIANGEVERFQGTSEETRRFLAPIEEALQRILDALLGSAWGGSIVVPPDFWSSDIGVVAARVRWWLSLDDLITISHAAALAFGENTQANRMRIARAIDGGQLTWVPDPSVANPQQNRRVLLPEVERLRDLRSLPE